MIILPMGLQLGLTLAGPRMNNEHFRAFEELFDYIYKGNKEASDLSLKLVKMANTLDDLADKDNEVADSDLYSLFSGALFDLPRSRMWVEFGLAHHLLGVYLRWKDANTIERDEKSTDDDLNKTYMLRAGIYDIFAIVAYYLYGEQWASEVGPTIRRFYAEKLGEYKAEMINARSNHRHSASSRGSRNNRG